MIRRPSQRGCMSADIILLDGISNSIYRGLDRRLTIKGTVQFSNDILTACQYDSNVPALGTYIVAPPRGGISIARE